MDVDVKIRHSNSSERHKDCHGLMRQKIEQAAMKTLLDYGLDAFTVDLVAQAANVGKGTIYRHFKNKKELLLCLRGRVYQTLKNDLICVVSSSLPAEKKIEWMLEKSLQFFISPTNLGSDFIPSGTSK